MATFELRNADDVRDALRRHGVRYLFFGKAGAILLGYSDTTHDLDLYVENNSANCENLIRALSELGFRLNEGDKLEIRRAKGFVQLRHGPFDLDVVFDPSGIERFEDAWNRRTELHGFPVANIDDIIQSKAAADRQRDRESLPYLREFRERLKSQAARDRETLKD
jgi:hypothetical protein